MATKKPRLDCYITYQEDINLRILGDKFPNESKGAIVGKAITFYLENYKNKDKNLNEILVGIREIEKILKDNFSKNNNDNQDITKYLCALWLGLRIKDLPTDEQTNISLSEFQQRLISSHNSSNNSSTNANNQQQNVETLDINRG